MMNEIFMCQWKRKGDKNKYFSMQFKSMWDFSDFFKNFLENDLFGEVLEIRIWKKERD